jgi:prepilin-type N-terminal cleavage/methylation domain-containing protein
MTRHAEKRLFAHDEGFSLVELMIVTMLLGVILGAAYMAIQMVTTVSDGIMARGEAQDRGQLALEKMVRELRQAQIINKDSDEYRFKDNSATKVSFYLDADHNGTVERVTYNCSGGQLTRSIASSGMENPTPDDFGADSAPAVMAKVDPTQTTVFQYLDGASPPSLVTDPDAVTAVQITLKAAAKSGSTSMTVTFPDTTVAIRAFPAGS